MKSFIRSPLSRIALPVAAAAIGALTTASTALATEVIATDIAIENPAFSEALWNAYRHVNESSPSARRSSRGEPSEFTAGAGAIRCRIVPRPPSKAPQCYLAAGKWETPSEGVASYKWFSPAATASVAALFEQMNVEMKAEREQWGVLYTKTIEVAPHLPGRSEDALACVYGKSPAGSIRDCSLSQGLPKAPKAMEPGVGSAPRSRRF